MDYILPKANNNKWVEKNFLEKCKISLKNKKKIMEQKYLAYHTVKAITVVVVIAVALVGYYTGGLDNAVEMVGKFFGNTKIFQI